MKQLYMVTKVRELYIKHLLISDKYDIQQKNWFMSSSWENKYIRQLVYGYLNLQM